MNSIDHNVLFSRHITETDCLLESTEARHAVSVLRLKKNDRFTAFDGNGAIYTCRLSEYGKNGALAMVENRRICERPPIRCTLFAGIPDREAFECILESVVPLGVARIVPVISEYCQKPWWKGKWEKHAERFERKIIAVLKQSRNPFMPDLHKPLPFGETPGHFDPASLVAEPSGQNLRHTQKLFQTGAISCVVGPPGGFSPTEIAALKKHETVFVRTGPYRQRTELAATVLCAMVMAPA